MALPTKLKKAFGHLKSTSNSATFEALVEIRRFLAEKDGNQEILREKNILEDLVKILGMPNEKNLDITLSILGNCCLEDETREIVSHQGIVRAVATVLNSTSRDSIQGRACRLISNLALSSSIAADLHKENVVRHLVNILDKEGSNSSATRQMAVRALRILWSMECERISMLGLNVVHKVAILLSTPYGKKEERELLKAVIKALTVFTHHCSDLCAQQIHAGDSGFQSLVSLCGYREMKESAVLCIFNLCHIGSSRPILGNAGAVSLVIKELSKKDSHKLEPTDHEIILISILCMFCRESVNRAKIRRKGGLPIILSVFRDSPNSSLQTSSLHGLTHFIYDELSLQELLKEGMLGVLIEKLGIFIRNHGCDHKKLPPENNSNSSKKRQNSSPVCNMFSDSPASGFCVSTEENVTKAREGNELSDMSCNSENWKRFRVSSPSYQAVVLEFEATNRYKDKISNMASPAHSLDSAYRSSSPEWLLSGENYHLGEWSPGSSKSFCFSPESSPPYGKQWSASPAYQNIASPSSDIWSFTSSPASHSSADADADFADVLYSPVCQDAQSDEETSPGDHKYSKSACAESDSGNAVRSDADLVGETLEFCDSPKSPEVLSSALPPEPVNEEANILVLISRVSHMETIVEDLADKTTLETLLDYLKLMKNPLPRASRILSRIIRAHHYFPLLLVHQFGLNIYSHLCERPHSSCENCDRLYLLGNNLLYKLSIVAETGFGEGELSYHLLKGENSFRERLAVTIPYIVKLPRLLRKLLIDCKGLDTLKCLVQSYPDIEKDLFKYIPTCLSQLATSLNICMPKCGIDETDAGNPAISELQISVEENTDIVSFLLDSGETVYADKNLLCEHSPVFDAMLRGHFKESVEETIDLRDMSAKAFENLVHLMKLGKVPEYLIDNSISSAMELLLMLDRFLLPGAEELSDLIIRQFLLNDTICEMYSIAHNYKGVLKEFDKIRLQTVEFFLVADVNMEKRTDNLIKLLKNGCSGQIQEDIFSILREKLERRRQSC